MTLVGVWTAVGYWYVTLCLVISASRGSAFACSPWRMAQKCVQSSKGRTRVRLFIFFPHKDTDGPLQSGPRAEPGNNREGNSQRLVPVVLSPTPSRGKRCLVIKLGRPGRQLIRDRALGALADGEIRVPSRWGSRFGGDSSATNEPVDRVEDGVQRRVVGRLEAMGGTTMGGG